MANLSNINNKFIVEDSGDVGIGVTTATTKLHIGGTAPGDSIIRQDSTVSGTNWEIGERAAGKWQIFEDDGDTIVATFMSTGNVGIGTASPSEILHLNKTSGTGCFIRFQNTGGSGVYIGGRSEVMEMYTNGSEKMRIDSSGNVGIGGTPSTFANFTNVTIQGGSSGSNLDFKNSSGTRVSAIVSTPSLLSIETNTTTPIIFKTNDTERMRITNGGQVQVGYYNTARGGANTTFMTGKSGTTYLELNGGDTSGEGGILFADGSGGNYGLINYSHVSDLMQFYTASAERMRISSNGRTLITVASGNTIQDTTLQLKATGASDNAGIMFINTGNTSSFNDIAGIASFVESGSAKGNLQFWTRNTDGANTDVATRMHIDSVGLATFRSTYIVAGLYGGEVTLGGASTTFGLQLKYSQEAATTSTIYHSPGYTSNDNLFKLGSGSGNSNQLVLRGNGNVGIGTDSPGDAKLYVNGGTTLGGNTSDAGATRIFGDIKRPQANYFVRRNYNLTAGSSGSLYNIARQWHDHANWGLGHINVIMWGIYYGRTNFNKADFSCRYGYSGGVADVVANFNPGNIAIPAWTAATQVSGNTHYRDLQIDIPAYWQISFEIISPGSVQTYNVNNTAGNTVYLYPH